MTTNFLDSFSGSSVSPSQVAFAEYTFGTNLVLYWPDFSAGQTNIAARFMNMMATAGSLNVLMPDATLVSVGYDVIIFNAGSNSFNVVDFDGGAIATIKTGETYYILVNDNATQAGGWQTVQFGVGTGSASAAALAGEGLIAAAGLLETNIATDLQSIDYTITDLSRARLQVWEGGAGVITLPTAASVGNGFFFPFANNGSASVTITPSGGDEIDGESTSVFTQTQSGFIVSSGTAWHTIGKGLQNNFSVTLLNLNVAGSSNVTETSAQAQNIIQQFTGALTGNISVIVPNTVQLYYIFNNTTGSHTLTVKTAAGAGFVVPQATHVILYCDGTNVLPGFSSTLQVVGTPTYSIGVAGGTANALTGNASNFVLQLGTVVWLTPGLLNTGAATLNVQATGDILIKKLAASGLVDLAANDLIPGLVVVVYYNGTYWIAVNIIYEGLYQVLSGNATMDFSYFLNSVKVTTTVNLTLPVTTLFPPYFYTTLFANGGPITLIPNAADSIQGGSAGTNYIIPQGASAKLATDGAGNWTLFLLSGISLLNSITNDTTTNATMYPVWVTANTGNLPLKVSSTKMSFNPSTGILTTIASTANALQTARTIGGVSFDGTANITVASAIGGFTISGGNLVLTGSTSGTTTIKSGAIAGTSVLTMPVTTDTLIGKATVDTLTNKTFDTAGVGNSLSIAGVAVTANSGTGSVVRATSPTMVTPTLSGITTAGAINTTGSITSTFTNAGSTSFPLLMQNNSSSSNTALGINLAPATNTAFSAQIVAVNDGLNNISMNFATSTSIDSDHIRLTIPSSGGLVVDSATGTTNAGDVNITGSYKINGVAPSSQVQLLSTLTASNSASLAFTSVITSAYDYYIFVLEDIRPATNGATLQFFTSANNGGSYAASYDYGKNATVVAGAQASMFIATALSNAAADAVSGKVELFNANGIVSPKSVRSSLLYVANGGTYTDYEGFGRNLVNTAVNAVKFQMDSGNITSGKIYCYGYKNT